jgi:hypothetical protein
MLPEPIEPLKGKAAREFLEYDKRPLTESEKKSLKEADRVYRTHQPFNKNAVFALRFCRKHNSPFRVFLELLNESETK